MSTVCGDISADDLGITLTHQHLLLDVTSSRVEPRDPYLRSIAEKPVDCSIPSDLRLALMISKDLLRLTDPNVAIEELAYFKAAGGSSLSASHLNALRAAQLLTSKLGQGYEFLIFALTSPAREGIDHRSQ